jgi:hypothetical protein
MVVHLSDECSRRRNGRSTGREHSFTELYVCADLFDLNHCSLYSCSTRYYDEGASFGDPSPVYSNASSVESSVSGSGYSGSLVTDVKYSILTNFASCDTVVVRWQSDSRSAKAKGVYVIPLLNPPFSARYAELTSLFCSTIPTNTSISYKGTDYLQVDLTTRFVFRLPINHGP